MTKVADNQKNLTLMVEMRREGKTLREVGKHFGISYERVRQLLRDTEVDGLRGKTKTQKRAEATYKEIKRLWDEGKSVKEIANQLGLQEDNLRSRMSEMRKKGWNLPYRPRPQTRYWKIKRLWHEGKSIKEIAEQLETTTQSLSVTMVRMRKSGWDLPYRHPIAR